MVTSTPRGPSLRVLDFGISKIMADDQAPNTGQTRTESAPAFSPAYAAPEQVSFSRTGPWTDVHALGLILTELMTDAPPFSDPDPEAHLFEQVMAPRRPTPASKGRNVGPFEPIVAKALALSPRDRWKNAGELLEALEAALAGRNGRPRGDPGRGRAAERRRDRGDSAAAAVEETRSARSRWRSRPPVRSGVSAGGSGRGASRESFSLRRNGRGSPPPTAHRARRSESRLAPRSPSPVAPPSSPPVPIVPRAAVQPTPAPPARSRPPRSAIRRTKRPASAPAPQTEVRDLFDDPN